MNHQSLLVQRIGPLPPLQLVDHFEDVDRVLFHPFRKLQRLILGHQVLQVIVDGGQFLIE